MIETRLSVLKREYTDAVRIGEEWRTMYKGKGKSLLDKNLLAKRCDILHLIYKTKEAYVKMYHGKRYQELIREYKEVLIEYSNLDDQMEKAYIERIVKEEKDSKKRLYGCIE